MKYIVITGASDGIGKATAIEFAHRGYSVLAVGKDQDKLRSVASDNVIPVVADLRNPQSFQSIIEQLNPDDTITCLIHCAVVPGPLKPLEELKLDDYESAMDAFKVNTLIPIFLTNFLKENKKFSDKARVIFMGSNFAEEAEGNLAPQMRMYAMTKLLVVKAWQDFNKQNKDLLWGYFNPGNTQTQLLDQVVKKRELDASKFTIAHSKDIANVIVDVVLNTDEETFRSTRWDGQNPAHIAFSKPIIFQSPIASGPTR